MLGCSRATWSGDTACASSAESLSSGPHRQKFELDATTGDPFHQKFSCSRAARLSTHNCLS